MKCKRFTIKDVNSTDTYILIGLLIGEDDGFYHIRTAKKKYTISKLLVMKVEQTDQLFRGYAR
jgi:hypothetical protein